MKAIISRGGKLIIVRLPKNISLEIAGRPSTPREALKALEETEKPKQKPLVNFQEKFDSPEDKIKVICYPVDVKIVPIEGEGAFFVSPIKKQTKVMQTLEKIAFSKFADWETSASIWVLKVWLKD